MKWTPGTQNDDVDDERGSTGGGGGGFGGTGLRLGGGGIVALLVVVVVARVFHVDIGGLFGSSNSSPAPTHHVQRTGPDGDAKLVDFVKFVMKDVQDTFEQMFRAEAKPYRHAKLVLFTSEINTGCGRSSSAIGPFYCPPDEKAYIDLSFYRELRDRFGAPGEFAEAYVLAHEIGHHLQKLMGIEQQAQRLVHDKKSRNDASVRQELQADCFAGVWGHSANERKLLDIGDIDQALNAASAIGDDRLEKQAGVEVNAETWTHGSSAQRVRWFKRGFDTGRFDACDTFSVLTP